MINILSNIGSTLTELGSPTFVGFTKVLNTTGVPNDVDKYMDSIIGVGHRVKHGHDLSSLPDIFDKFGLKGIYFLPKTIKYKESPI